MLPYGTMTTLPGIDTVCKVPDPDSIDIEDSQSGIAIEMKSKWRAYPLTFPLSVPQMISHEERYGHERLYWAFLVYSLRVSRDSLTKDNLPRVIDQRQVIFLDWAFVAGRVDYAQRYFYIKADEFPKAEYFESYRMSGGMLHVHSGSPLEDKILKSRFLISKEPKAQLVDAGRELEADEIRK